MEVSYIVSWCIDEGIGSKKQKYFPYIQMLLEIQGGPQKNDLF